MKERPTCEVCNKESSLVMVNGKFIGSNCLEKLQEISKKQTEDMFNQIRGEV